MKNMRLGNNEKRVLKLLDYGVTYGQTSKDYNLEARDIKRATKLENINTSLQSLIKKGLIKRKIHKGGWSGFRDVYRYSLTNDGKKEAKNIDIPKKEFKINLGFYRDYKYGFHTHR